MNRSIGISFYIAAPALVGYGAGKLFGLSPKVTMWLTIGGAVLGAAGVLTIYEALEHFQ